MSDQRQHRRSSGQLLPSLPDALTEFIDSQLATKSYGNVSRYVRNLLRGAQGKEEAAHLGRLLLEGPASSCLPLDADFLKGIEGRTVQILGRDQDRQRP